MKKINVQRLHFRFKKLVNEWFVESGGNQQNLADKVGIQRTHLNSLISGVRPLTTYYILLFIMAGIFKVSEIYDGQAETKREREFWEMAPLTENVDLLHKIAEAKKQGFDIEQVLDAFLSKK